MAMESQAEALGQLATDDLEGKVKMNIYKPIIKYLPCCANGTWLSLFIG